MGAAADEESDVWGEGAGGEAALGEGVLGGCGAFAEREGDDDGASERLAEIEERRVG